MVKMISGKKFVNRLAAAVLTALLALPTCSAGAAEAKPWVRELDTCPSGGVMYDFSDFETTAAFIADTSAYSANTDVAIRQVTYGGVALQLQGWVKSSFSFTLNNMSDVRKNYGYARVCLDVQGYTAADTPSSSKSSAISLDGNTLFNIGFKSGNKVAAWSTANGSALNTREYHSASVKLSGKTESTVTLNLGSSLPTNSMCVNIKYIAFFKTQSDADNFDESVLSAEYKGTSLDVDGSSHTVTGYLPTGLTLAEANALSADVDFDFYNISASADRSYSTGYVKSQSVTAKMQSEHFAVTESGDTLTLSADCEITDMTGKSRTWSINLTAPYSVPEYQVMDFSHIGAADSMIADGTIVKTPTDGADKLCEKPINYGGPALEFQHKKYPQFLAKFKDANPAKKHWVKMVCCFERTAIADGKTSAFLSLSWYDDPSYNTYHYENWDNDSLPQSKVWQTFVCPIEPSTRPYDLANKQIRVFFNGFNANVLIKYIGLFDTEENAKNFDNSLESVTANGELAELNPFDRTATVGGSADGAELTLYNAEAQTGTVDNGYPESRVTLVSNGGYTLKNSHLAKCVTLKDVCGNNVEWYIVTPTVASVTVQTEGGVLKAEFDGVPDGFKRIAALYSADGSLKKFVLADNGNIRINNINGEYTVKAFLWNDFNSLIPVTEAKALKNSFVNFGTYDTKNTRGKVWEGVPLVSAKQKVLGYTGGEGAQVQTYMTIASDGSYLLTFADVGNILRSTDGVNWIEVGKNINDTGLSCGVIDPVNPDRVVGATYQGITNTDVIKRQGYTGGGVYVSENRADTFTQTLILNDTKILRSRDAIAFDITSAYENGVEGCSKVYFSTSSDAFEGNALTISNYEQSKGYNSGCGLYRSDDGGYTWAKVNGDMSACELAVSPLDGTVFAVKDNVLYKSADYGKTFSKIAGGIYDVKTLDENRADYVYTIGENGVSISKDNGRTFTKVASKNYENDKKGTTDFEVSAKNPNYMAFTCGKPGAAGSYSYRIRVSHDGGVTWITSEYDESCDFFRVQPRQNQLVFDPNNENILYSSSDWPWRSTNGGVTFRQSANGVNAVCVNSRWQPNVYNPDLWLVPAQDFVGAVTTDGGKTFRSLMDLNKGGTLMSHSYGGYAVSENTWFLCSDKDWEENSANLMITFDGGKTWQDKGKIVESGYIYNICGQSKRNPDILWAGDVRSTDGGKTWSKMDSRIRCIADSSADGSMLFAFAKDSGYNCYVSYDDGETWSLYFTAPKQSGKQYDTIQYVLDYNDGDGCLYYGQAGSLFRYSGTAVKQLTLPTAMQNVWWWSFAIDATHPGVMYAAGEASAASQFTEHSYKNSIFRTTDYGRTWQTISNKSTGDTVVPNGPVVGRHNIKSMFVSPTDGYLYVSMANQGVYKFAPPYVTD